MRHPSRITEHLHQLVRIPPIFFVSTEPLTQLIIEIARTFNASAPIKLTSRPRKRVLQLIAPPPTNRLLFNSRIPHVHLVSFLLPERPSTIFLFFSFYGM
jgi:hypothetical protein